VSYPNHIALSIAGGDSLVGHALEQMLQNAGYKAQFLEDSTTNGSLNPFEGTSLVLLGPRTSCAKREALLGRLRNGRPDKLEVPVVELVGNGGGEDGQHIGGGVRRVLWPCQFKVLKQEIESALTNGYN
jgi:hypothetical protein